MPMDKRYHTNLRVSLRDKNNGTYRGNLVLKNWTVWYGNHDNLHNSNQITPSAKPTELVDPVGASYYVIAVVLVYGMSIVALIASHIKRKHVKLIEDRQINKYLREFQTVKERQSRESYKNLKKTIKEQINWEKPTSKAQTILHNNLSQALIPMIAVGISVPRIQPTGSIPNIYFNSRSRSGSLLNSLNNIAAPRSRTSSVGSYTSIASMPALSNNQLEKSPSLPKDRHERKRGLGNLLGNQKDDFPLEKILEESWDSRASSFRRKSSKRSSRKSAKSTASSLTSLNISGSGKGVLFGLSSSDFESQPPPANNNFSPEPSFTPGIPEISRSTSELGSSVEPIESPNINGPSPGLGDSGMGITSPDMENPQTCLNGSSILPGVHSGGYNKQNSPHSNIPRASYLTVPAIPNLEEEEPIWVPSSNMLEVNETDGRYNNGFRHSPSPTKSKGAGSSPNRGTSPNLLNSQSSPKRGNSPYTISAGHSPKRGNSPYTISGGLSPRRSPIPTSYYNSFNNTESILCEHNMSDESDSEKELLQITCV